MDPKIEQLDGGASSLELRSVIRWWRKLLQHLASHASSRLLHAQNRAVSEVALDKQHHLVILDEDLVAEDTIEPPLHRSLNPKIILISTCASRSHGRRHGRNESFRVGRDQVVGKLGELGVSAANIAVLSRAELGNVGLYIRNEKSQPLSARIRLRHRDNPRGHQSEG